MSEQSPVSIFHRSESLHRVLMDVSRQAALERLQQEGVAIVSWDPAAVARLDARPFADIPLCEVTFENYDVPRRIPDPVFGSVSIRLESVSPPWDAFDYNHERHDRDQAYAESMQYTVDNIEFPARALTIWIGGHHTPSTSGIVQVITFPAPKRPVVIQSDTLLSARHTLGSDRKDIGLLDQLVEHSRDAAPGDVWPVEELSERNAAALCKLVRTVGRHIAEF